MAMLSILPCLSQTMALSYGYDAAGNRIARHVVPVQPQQAPQLNTPHGAPVGHPSGEITVTPTVTNGDVTILSQSDECGLQWQLVDAQGRVVARGDTDMPVVQMKVDGVAGVYLLNVRKGTQAKTFKLVKL